MLSAESNSVVSATAYGFRILASEWQSYSISERAGDNAYDAKGLAEKFAALAAQWETIAGEGGTLQAGVIALDFMQKGTLTDG